jgi:hypothetical protein
MLVSNDITEHLEDPRPSVALNLMGLSLIAKNPSYEKKCVFWVDGIFGALFCRYKGLRTEKKRGLSLFTELVDILSSGKNGKVVVLGEAGGYPRMSRKLFKSMTTVELPTYKSNSSSEQAEFYMETSTELVILAIGSPKQEIIAQKNI